MTAAGILVPSLGAMIWIVFQFLFPGLLSSAPMFGFVGFAGFLGLYEPPTTSRVDKAA